MTFDLLITNGLVVDGTGLRAGARTSPSRAGASSASAASTPPARGA
ncbi:MAG: hypothetical protein U0900_17330 [Myxococcota bacterium]